MRMRSQIHRTYLVFSFIRYIILKHPNKKIVLNFNKFFTFIKLIQYKNEWLRIFFFEYFLLIILPDIEH